MLDSRLAIRLVSVLYIPTSCWDNIICTLAEIYTFTGGWVGDGWRVAGSNENKASSAFKLCLT
jgi:hypothetical protein